MGVSMPRRARSRPDADQDARAALASAGRAVIARGLTWGTSGNVSLRLDDRRFLISASGARLDALDDQSLAECTLADDTWRGSRRPSVEVNLHRAVYRARPEARAVLHTSAPFTTLLACSRLDFGGHFSTDGLFYVRDVARVPFHNPGTLELAEAAAERSHAARVLLLDNHGSLCWGESLDEVVTATEALEFNAAMLVRARAAAIDLAYFTAEEIAAFSYHAGPAPEGSS
jgi:ribulose-5-phosphate 4-epimerase/fuculose-1-phosphate aldolase